MADRTSTNDPPDQSPGPDPDRRKPTKPQPDLKARNETKLTRTGPPGLQNAQRSKNRSSLDFHKTAHSFPDYGSLKGAVRMSVPPPLSKHPKIYSPRVHVDTLHSNTGRIPSPLSTARPAGFPSPPKRQKLQPGARQSAREDEVTDTDWDPIPRTKRHGSQSSFAHSTSPGVFEYQTVEASTKRDGRSNRRSRQSPPNLSSIMKSFDRRQGRIPRAESVQSFSDEFDQLAPVFATAVGQRTARLVSTAGQRHSATISDAADNHILGKSMRSRQRPSALARGKKRSSHEVIEDSEDQDELAGEPQRKRPANISPGPTTEESAEHDPKSLSRRGDLKPTDWQSKSNPASEFAVKAAVCQPNLRYGLRDDDSTCFLKPTSASELRAFTEDGGKAMPYDWLKVSSKTRILSHHPGSHLVRIQQSTDQTSSAHIGAKLMISFHSSVEASRFADWVRTHFDSIRVEEADGGHSKLNLIWDNLHGEITKARSQPASSWPPTEKSALSPGSTERASTRVAIQPDASPASRTRIRHQMRVSTQQQQTPSRSEAGSSITSVSLGPRVTRARQAVQPIPESAICRWSDENRDWAKDWKMPLILARTTVDKEDIPRLDEGQFLNDNLIGYGLRYLFDKLNSRHKDLHKRVYLHNSFFYEKLKAGRGAINYDGVKNWTAKVDLLSYDYIVVPVNEHYHWWVAIICNPGKLDPDVRKDADKTEGPRDSSPPRRGRESSDVEMTDVASDQPPQPRSSASTDGAEVVESDIVDLVSGHKGGNMDLTSSFKAKRTRRARPGTRTYNPKDPRIITLDSLGSTHGQAVTHLKKYLLAEFEHKRNKIITDPPQHLGMRAMNIPEQNNLCDCGVYLLGYIQEFVKNPDGFIQTLLRKDLPEWNFDPSHLRRLWRDTILKEQRMYQEDELRKRRAASAAKQTSKADTTPGAHPNREPSEVSKDASGNRGTGKDSTAQPASSKPGRSPRSSIPPEGGSVSSPSPIPSANGNQEPRPSSPSTSSGNAQQQSVPQPPSRDQGVSNDVVILPPEVDDAVLPSIEAPDLVELPGPPRRSPVGDEPRFVGPLPSSSPSSADNDKDKAVEVIAPASFYASSAGRSRSGSVRTAAAHSSPSAGGLHRRPAAKTRPGHTSSHFMVASPEDESAVVRADVVMSSDPIDLT